MDEQPALHHVVPPAPARLLRCCDVVRVRRWRGSQRRSGAVPCGGGRGGGGGRGVGLVGGERGEAFDLGTMRSR